MTDNAPQFVDNDAPLPPIVRGQARNRTGAAPLRPTDAQRPAWIRYITGIDIYALTVVGMLLAVSLMMVYSTTFDWGYRDFNSRAYFLVRHMQTMAVGLFAMVVMSLIDYRIIRRFALPALLAVIGALVAVLLFGDDTFNARRGLIGGRFQPGEAAQLVMVIYMAAWLSGKRTKIRSITYGLIPFAVLVGFIGSLVFLQPDLSTAVIIFATSGAMFFLAGANIIHIAIAGTGIVASVFFMVQQFTYAQDRVATYLTGIRDLTQTNYHVQQAVLAFIEGGWFGVGLGAGRQKFGYLPAPHTDSIFASIGEELGFFGAALVILLYAAFVFRGFAIAYRARDSFGSLLAAGVTIWLVAQALLNVAVMTAAMPATGVPLPLISYGGSSMTALLTGVGIMLSVSRVSAKQQTAMERRTTERANIDRSRRNRGARVSRSRGRRGN
ncbi:MAG: putative peptidoglycan glycosyltransferase FtsW [Chloroflexota bacterium]